MDREEPKLSYARIGLLGASLAPLALFLSGPVMAQEELNALVWCDHTDPALIEPFEEQHDVKVNLKDYEGTGTALSLIEQSRPGDWDVFVVDSVDVPRVVDAGILAPLPRTSSPGRHLSGAAQEGLHFKDGQIYAVPEKFGYNTLAYNKDKVDPADMDDMTVLWGDEYKGRIAVYDYYIPLMGMVAIGLGMKTAEISEPILPPSATSCSRSRTTPLWSATSCPGRRRSPPARSTLSSAAAST